MAFNVFVSYSATDSFRIKPILELLKKIPDVEIFFAEESINPGSEVSKTIANSIRGCNFFLVFYSAAARVSNYVQQEIGLAKASSKMIIPILLDGTRPDAMLSGINYVDLSDSAKVQSEFNRLYGFITSNVQQQQQIKVIGLVALAILAGLAIFGKE